VVKRYQDRYEKKVGHHGKSNNNPPHHGMIGEILEP